MDEQQLTELNSALVRARAQVADARARLAGIEHVGPTGLQLDSLPESLRSGVIASLRSQQAEAQKRIDNLGMQLGPRHPELLEARQQLRGVETLIGNELKRIASALRNEMAVAGANEAAAARALDTKKRDMTGTNAARVELRTLERAVLADKATYDRLLAADSTLQQEGVSTPIARPLAPALLPLRPTSPNTRAILLVAAALGLALGLAAALMREHRARLRPAPAPSPAPQPPRVRRSAIVPTPAQTGSVPDGYLKRFHAYSRPVEAGQ
jgi:succinoglycan biosynthesis transport protein ExoP